MNLPAEKMKGILFVLSAPSGTGKTTLAEAVMRKTPGLTRSISHTTRPIRKGEVDGVDYHFVDEPTFQNMVADGIFLEWATVHGKLYGTSLENIRRTVEDERKDILLVIDVQGAWTLRDKGAPHCGIFLLPPSIDELKKRLAKRGTDTEEGIKARLDDAKSELAEATSFDYVVVNDDLETAVDQLAAIVSAERSRVENNMIHLTEYYGL